MMINNCYKLLCEISKLEEKVREVQRVALANGIELDSNAVLQEIVKKIK